jgi:small subunit ribosomal protein S20
MEEIQLPSKTSTAKRHRQSEAHRLRNKSVRSAVKSQIKKYLAAIDQKDRSAAEAEFKQVSSLLDSAAGKGVYHKNNAARKKSRLHKKLSELNPENAE